MLADLFEVKGTDKKGKGLFAKTFIPAGTVVCVECDQCRTLTAEELGYDAMSDEEKTSLIQYAYRKKDGTFVAPCGDVKYFNHSCNANVLGTEFGFDIAVRDIEKGEEATFDYRDFYDDVAMRCCCGDESCCGIVTFEHPVPEELERFWREKIAAALKRANSVEQPLKNTIRNFPESLPGLP